MTKEEIARLRALCEAATPGLWEAVGGVVLRRTYGEAPKGRLRPHDATVLAKTANALPHALDEVERLRTALRDYGRHHDGGLRFDGSDHGGCECASEWGEDYECDCGFEEALR